MAKPLGIREEARAELLHETMYYESQREGAGRRFREAVDASFDLILLAGADQHRLTFGATRHHLS